LGSKGILQQYRHIAAGSPTLKLITKEYRDEQLHTLNHYQPNNKTAYSLSPPSQ